MPLIKKAARIAAAVIICSAATFAQAQDGSGSPTEIEPTPAVQSTRFDDWHHRCVDVKVGNGTSVRQCEVVQVAQIRQGESNVDVLTLAIAKTAPANGSGTAGGQVGGDLLLTVLVPLNVVLPPGLGLVADGRDLGVVPYRNCNQAGCWAQQKLDENMLAALRKGTAGEARLRLMNGQPINLRFSLKGLTRALAALQESSKI